MIRLSKSQVLLIHDQLISETGGSSGLRDEGMLDPALNAPFQTFGGEDVYPSLRSRRGWSDQPVYCILEKPAQRLTR